MTAKEYLLQIHRLELEIQRLNIEIDRAREEVAIIKSTWPDGYRHTDGPKDPVGDAVAQLLARIEGLEAKQIQTRSRLWLRRSEVINTIGKLKNIEQVDVITQHYIDGKKLRQVAKDKRYSYRQVLRIHEAGLEEIKKIIEK